MGVEIPHRKWQAGEEWWHGMLLPPILELAGEVKPGMRVLDIGCGNGWIGSQFVQKGATVVGVDPSEFGIRSARETCPEARWEMGEATPDLREKLGEAPFDLVISSEVVEHVYDPDAWCQCAANALKPGGRLVLTTPHHGYIKNLLIAVTDKWDSHHDTLTLGGHIRFWSKKTITQLLERNGFTYAGFRGAGRVPPIWKSMVVSATLNAR